jgi:transposase-like protein
VRREGNVLDILVRRRRGKQAAKKFFRKIFTRLLVVGRVGYLLRVCYVAAA